LIGVISVLNNLSNILIAVTTIVSTIAAIMGVNNRNAIKNVHLDINSRMTELLKATTSAAHAEGAKDGLKDDAAAKSLVLDQAAARGVVRIKP